MSTPNRTSRRLIAASLLALVLPMAAMAQPNYEGLGPLAADRSGSGSDRLAAAPDRPGAMPHGHRHGGHPHHAHAHHGPAQRSHGQPHHGHPHHGLHHGHSARFHGAGADMMPFARGPGGGAALLRGLRLDEAQRDRVFEIMHAQAPAMRAQVKALRTAREQLNAASLSGSYDEARAQSLAQTVGQAHAEVARLRAGAMQAVYQVLTPEQRRQVEQRRMQPGDGSRRSMPG